MLFLAFPYRYLMNKRGLTERGLAFAAQISRGCVRAVFNGGEKCSLNSIVKVAEALGQKVSLIVSSCEGLPEYSVVAAAIKIEHEGFDSWKIHLMEFVDEFRRTVDARLILLPPPASLDEKLRALFSSTVAELCLEAGMEAPEWTRKTCFLPAPWFLSGMNSLKASALLESPLAFRRNNLFVQQNFLQRV
jgi:hypothetical protein